MLSWPSTILRDLAEDVAGAGFAAASAKDFLEWLFSPEVLSNSHFDVWLQKAYPIQNPVKLAMLAAISTPVHHCQFPTWFTSIPPSTFIRFTPRLFCMIVSVTGYYQTTVHNQHKASHTNQNCGEHYHHLHRAGHLISCICIIPRYLNGSDDVSCAAVGRTSRQR